MWDVISWLFFIAFIAGLIVVAGWLVRGYVTNGSSASPFGGSLFQPRQDRRLEVVEHANVDGRRKLLIIRRDNVEHLVMTGGPVDVVLETGIDTRSELRKFQTDPQAASSAPTSIRPARRIGQAVND